MNKSFFCLVRCSRKQGLNKDIFAYSGSSLHGVDTRGIASTREFGQVPTAKTLMTNRNSYIIITPVIIPPYMVLDFINLK